MDFIESIARVNLTCPLVNTKIHALPIMPQSWLPVRLCSGHQLSLAPLMCYPGALSKATLSTLTRPISQSARLPTLRATPKTALPWMIRLCWRSLPASSRPKACKSCSVTLILQKFANSIKTLIYRWSKLPARSIAKALDAVLLMSL